jgi:hypothetical protein
MKDRSSKEIGQTQEIGDKKGIPSKFQRSGARSLKNNQG